MKADARREFDDGPERGKLREALRRWPAPPVPDELEAVLRLEFRKRRRKPRPVLWLSLAASLVLLAGWPLVAPRRGTGHRAASPAVPRAVTQRPSVARGEAPETTVVHVPPRAAASPRAARRRASKPAVVVEPGQAELLAEFGRATWERTQAAGASVSAMPETKTPAFRAEWEEVAGTWPTVQVAMSRSGR